MQFYREIVGIGLFRFVVLLGIVFLLFAFLYLQTSEFSNAVFASFIVLLLILTLHIKRNDKIFLRVNFSNTKWIFFIEYLLLSLVLQVFLIVHSFGCLAFLNVAIIGIIVQLDFKRKQSRSNSRVLGWLPAECFEWKSGIRKHFPVILTIWLLGISFSFFVGGVPIALIVLGFIFLSFLEKSEPYQMVIAFEKDPNGFLSLKIRQQTAILLAVSAPLILSYQIFHFHLWYIPFIVLIVFCILLVYAILMKYAFYEPNGKSQAAQIFMVIGIVCLIMPIFAPIIVLLTLRFYLKAKKNLSHYLNDYH